MLADRQDASRPSAALKLHGFRRCYSLVNESKKPTMTVVSATITAIKGGFAGVLAMT